MAASIIKNLIFASSAKYLGGVIGLAVMAVLARLIPPEDFGTIAIGSVFIAFFGMLGDMGLAPAVVRFSSLDKEDFRSIFGFTFWIAVLSGVLFYLLSFPIGMFYGSTDLTRVCRWLTLMLMFSILNIVPQNLLIRQKRFDIIARRVIVIQIVMGALSIFFAFRGWWFDALLLSSIGTMILTFAANTWSSRIRPKFVFNKTPIKIISEFSIFQLLFNIVCYAGQNIDRLVIGKALNISQMAFFDKARNLSLQPVHNISGVATSVIYPYLVTHDNSTLQRIYSLVLRISFVLSFPISAFCIGSSRELITLIFGHQWVAAILPFSILSFSIIMEIPHVMEGTIMQTCGHTRQLFKLGCIKAVISISSLIIFAGVWKSMEAVCISVVLSSFSSVLLSIWWIFRECFAYRLGIVHLKYVLVPLMNFMAVYLSILLFDRLFWNVGLISSLIIKLTSSIVITCLILYCTKYVSWNQMLWLFGRKGVLSVNA